MELNTGAKVYNAGMMFEVVSVQGKVVVLQSILYGYLTDALIADCYKISS
jgi:hypothetical protein